MRLKVCRNGKDIKTNTVVSFLSQRRELLEEAFPGDITSEPGCRRPLTRRRDALQFTGLLLRRSCSSVELVDPMKSKQLRIGLTQLGEEGAIQVFRPHAGGALLLGAIGPLQFEVVAHRLRHEYGVEARFLPSRHQMARWVTADDPTELAKFIDANAHRVAYDSVDAPTFLVTYRTDLTVAEDRWKKLRFHALREHAGLVFQQRAA